MKGTSTSAHKMGGRSQGQSERPCPHLPCSFVAHNLQYMIAEILNTCSTCSRKFRAPWQDDICPSYKLKRSSRSSKSTARYISIRTSRNNGKITQILSEEILKWLYYRENKSLNDIAKEYRCTSTRVLQIMKGYGLKRRTLSEARIEAIKKGRFTKEEFLVI